MTEIVKKKVENLLKELTYKKVDVSKSKVTYGRQKRVYLKRKDGRKMAFDFHEGRLGASLKDMLYCLITDRSLYLSSGRSTKEFADMLDYDLDQAKIIIDIIKVNDKNLKNIFSRRELEQLTEYFSEY